MGLKKEGKKKGKEVVEYVALYIQKILKCIYIPNENTFFNGAAD